MGAIVYFDIVSFLVGVIGGASLVSSVFALIFTWRHKENERGN